jgi:hypothetical protein
MLGRVYIIQSPNTDKVYIGSTFLTLEKRFCRHKRSINGTSSYLILDEGDAFIELLEEIKVIDKDELRYYEQQYIELYRDIAVNKFSAFGEDKEKMLTNKKIYHRTNRKEILEQFNQKFKCSCGGKYTYSNKLVHFRTKLHKNYVAQE